MLRRLNSLYARYAAAHMDTTLPGCPITDETGETVGYVDAVRLRAGRLQVMGWARAARLRLVLAGAEDSAAPILRREDVATALGVPPTVGFDLSLPATPATLAQSEAPGLVVTPLPDAAPIPPISLRAALPRRHRAWLGLSFAGAALASLPDAMAWALRRDPTRRARVKHRLGLGRVEVGGAILSALIPGPKVAEPAPLPDTRVDIVLPVYNAFDLLQDCLERVEAHTDLPWRLILVEDGSTDTRVLPFLRDWADARDQVELLENPENLGFIGAVNRGLAQALADEEATGPVVLLNSDALVPAGWASRLAAPLVDPTVASVTPMSNDAEIFSVPVICSRTVLEPGQGEVLDAVAARIGPDAPEIAAPTGVGFCMGLGRSWLERQPKLDPAFGRGYGEEVDWCQKVARQGGRHLGLPGLFVEHRGGESFGSAEKVALVAKNNAIVARRYPGYDQCVQDFIAADPLLTARLALGLAWAGSLEPARAVPVYLAHTMGGGADHWLDHRVGEDLESGYPSVILRVGGRHRWQIELVTPQGCTTGHSDDSDEITALLKVMPRRRMVYSCGVGDPDPIEIPELLASLTGPKDDAEMLFHDYFPLSPSYTLLDGDGGYRGPVRLPRADQAHTTRRLDGSAVTLRDWQAAWVRFAARADLVVFSKDSAAQVAAVWPRLKQRIVLRPHRLRPLAPPVPAPADGTPPVLAVLGNIGQQKGAKVVQDLARMRAQDGQDPALVLIGNIDPAFGLPDTIEVHGSYRVDDLPNLVRRYGITHWLIPSVWPETFCFTVHEALATGLPVLAFGLGAQGAAVRAAENGIEMPFDLGHDLAQTVRDHMAGATAQTLQEEA